MTTTVVASRIAGGPYLSTADTIDVGTRAPVETTYWDGTAYVTKYGYRQIRPGSLVALVSSALAPTLALDLSAMQVMMVEEVTASPPGIAWYSPEPNTLDFLPYTEAGAAPLAFGARSLPALQGTRLKFTRTLGRTITGGGASGQSLYDYVVLLEQTGATATEAGLRFYGQTTTTAAVAPGDKIVPIASSFAQFIPVAQGGAYPSIPASVLGADAAVFLATGGRVSIFRQDEAVVLHHTATIAAQVVANAQDVDVGRTRLAKLRVIGANGIEITTGFTANLTTGHAVFNAVAGYSQPVTIEHRIEDMLLIGKALEQRLETARGATHDFPIGSRVSSAIIFGDLQAKVGGGFEQTTWSGEWSAVPIGTIPLAQYNQAANPITVTNAGAITEWWAVIFTSATTFKVVGSQVGEVVAGNAGSTATVTAPLNPATGAPYFSMPATGWGTGWATGNVFRFNTFGANGPVWVMRSIAPSDPFAGLDKFSLALRGNVNA